MVQPFSPLYVDKLDPWSSHSLVSDRLLALPPNTRVLDVGTATGTLGRLCSDHGLILHGVEPDYQSANLARQYYHSLLCTTIDHAPDNFVSGFGAVVCADILEHLPDPERSLQRLVDLQFPGTLFLISVPNIANIWVRLNLLMGRFDYTDRGILDKTHLRFFTKRSLLALTNKVGLCVHRLTVTPIPLYLVHPSFRMDRVGYPLYQILARLSPLFPTLLGYQFVIEANKGGQMNERV